MEFRVLGPVDICHDGRSIAVVGPKQRTLLALLVLQANRVVSHDRVLTALWGGKVPATGRRLIHNHLWSLRRLLADPQALVSSSTGYSLKLQPGASDLDVFLAETARARSVLDAGNPLEASNRFREALSLWRGPALGGTQPEFQTAEGAPLEELRLSALMQRIEADLALGRHAESIGELRLLVTGHPLNEGLRGQLMRVLHKAGRTAEALDEFRAIRLLLRDDLGLDPGEELVRIHQVILSGESTPETVAAEQPSTGYVTPVPRQLPADISRFTGRAESLRRLDLLLSTGRETTAVVTSAIAGTAGVGKTALATHWGHRVAARFPDGQLYIDLRGYSSGRPTTGAQALSHLLRALGVASDEIPHDIDERAALYRSLLAGRRLLIVLDNAAASDQVRLLLPGSTPSRVVITSRDSLRGLSVTHDVQRITLDVLPAEEALALLTALLGTERVANESSAVAELARLCGYLPLALRLAAAQLASRPTLRIADFAARLERENQLSVLELEEDPHIGVRSALELSYRSLSGTAQRTFRLLGLQPGPSIGLEAVAVLTGMTNEEACAAVDTLFNAHLLQLSSDRRVTMHDLVRVYARERAETGDTEADRAGALTRMFDWYESTVYKAALHVERSDVEFMTLTPLDGTPDFDDFDGAVEWLEAEQRTLVAMIVYAAEEGWHVYAWRLAHRLRKFFYIREHFDDWLMTSEIALHSARLVGDREAEAHILNDRGFAMMFTGRYDENVRYQQEALEIWRSIGETYAEARCLRMLSYGLQLAGRLGEAAGAGEQSIALYRELDRPVGENAAMDAIALIYMRLGRLDEALDLLLKCQRFWEGQGRKHDAAYGLLQIAVVRMKVGEPEVALNLLEQALRLARELQSPRIEADVFSNIGMALRYQERYPEAMDHHEKALALVKKLRSRQLESEVLNELAATCLASGDVHAALGHYREALTCADEANEVYQQGFANSGLGQALHRLGRIDEAVSHWKVALDIFTSTGVPEAEDVGRWIYEAEQS
ncbi:BTAD domain-containing putative transcriptional regulator [Planobispora siamensis]|uniref:SARP family transcriptional regulator n=1 Tax=Planobispora siamensis TaxID=936338 RepID=A0A8J3SV02_9ACTN|nr:BTAD domain-containing putative transcriptional regulator [Planobispora siamensis]GIH96088.1 SARP family transcriptional regulator [Planobispora siamensis]